MMTDFAPHKRRSVFALLLLATAGCANLAGIEEAQRQAVGSGGTTSASTSPQDSNLCATYCDTVMANCRDELAVYASPDTCMGVCSKLQLAGKAGTPGDDNGNTIQCRLTQARSAKSTGEPSAYCFKAGPGGGQTCGSDCEGYCVLLQQTCPNEFSSPQFNNSITYCLTTACPAVPPSDAGFSAEQESGNNINCRLYHVSAANAGGEAPGTHCPHAAGAKPCID